MKPNEEIFELVAQRFRVLAEPTRLKVLFLLKDGEKSVGEIAQLAGLRHGTASANLNALQKEGVLECRREGTRTYYRIGDPQVFQLCELVCGSIRQDLLASGRLGRSLL